MKDPVPVLVCDTAGPVGSEILQRREVVAYWAIQPEEAQAVLAEVHPKLALVRRRFAGAVLPNRGSTAVVVLMDEAGWAEKDQLFALGATALASEQSGEKILEAVSELTGLAFARHPRVSYKTAVELTVQGEARLAETVNLSASGLCVRNVGELKVGSGVDISFPLLEPSISAQAVVVRCFEDAGVPMAGLCFSQLSPATRERLDGLVAEETAKNPGAPIAFELPELDEAVTSEERRPSEEALQELKARLREVHQEAQRDARLASPRKDSATRLAGRLTPAEKATVSGGKAPVWAKTALETRLKLHLDRQEHGRARSTTVREALVLCRSMATGATDARSRVEVCATRAALLREVYAEPIRARHGTAQKIG